jgi:signal transduction histidine kinase/DNA-binding response OmpR family regulator
MSRILVVDDDPHVARTLVDLLAHHGYAATRAESGEQGLEMLHLGGFDLVVLDVRLPGISGFETCARIREGHGVSLPVIMLTALGDAASLREGYEAGADDFLQKPVDTPALILKVRAFLRLKALHDETVRHREEAQARAQDLALLHEIGRDWSLIAEPEEFNRMVTQRLATLIDAQVCFIALYDSGNRVMTPALPAHGLPDEVARRIRYVVEPGQGTLWSLRSGRPYVNNRARTDPRLLGEDLGPLEVDSVLLVPILSEGSVLGMIVAANKPGGFTEADAQLLAIFAGPAASFLHSRQIFGRERIHARRLERMAALVGRMGATVGRSALLELLVTGVQADFGYHRVAFFASDDDRLRRDPEAEASVGEGPRPDGELLDWAQKGARPLQAARDSWAELAVPVRAGEQSLGVIAVLHAGPAFAEDEVNLVSTLASQLAVALKRAESVAHTQRLAAQMATLYDVGLETGALRDLRQLFVKAAEEAGRLIRADHASVLRFDEEERAMRMFAAWTREPSRETFNAPIFRFGEGIAGKVARDRLPAMINDAEAHRDFVARGNPVARLMCVPLLYFDQERQDTVLFGVLNATRRPGSAAFTQEDLDYLTRFAGQLSIAVANSMAFAAERERSEQLALVNTLLREIAGSLSRERVLETAARRIHEAFRFPVVALAVPEPAGVLRMAALISRDPRPESDTFPQNTGVMGRAFREKRTVRVRNVSADPDYLPLFPSTRSEVAVPILAGDEVVAVLNVESDERNAFDRGKVITLETLADGIGIILRNAELYQALETTNSKLVELDRMKSELVNIVAHDFRAPLAGVLGHAELLEWQGEAPLEDRVENARAIVQAATHMANLVDKTLKTNRLESGHFPFEFGLQDLGAVVREVLERLPVDARHPAVLDLPEEPLPAWADRDRLVEVLDNLLSNAVKYSPGGGEVCVSVSRTPDMATVTVSDHGIGIEARAFDRLFRPFSRIRDRNTADIEGSGLGLYICDRIVRAHGGRLWVESRPGEGSAFSFSLPLYGATAQSRPPLVLVAAADDRTRREVRRVAEEQGFATHEVADGVEAIEAAFRLVPVAVVLDRVLPKLGAREVAERLKDHATTECIHLFALAGREEVGGRADLFTAYVPKPLDPSALAAALDSVARSGQAAS